MTDPSMIPPKPNMRNCWLCWTSSQSTSEGLFMGVWVTQKQLDGWKIKSHCSMDDSFAIAVEMDSFPQWTGHTLYTLTTPETTMPQGKNTYKLTEEYRREWMRSQVRLGWPSPTLPPRKECQQALFQGCLRNSHSCLDGGVMCAMVGMFYNYPQALQTRVLFRHVLKWLGPETCYCKTWHEALISIRETA